jgi:hypothetical protein
MRKRIIGHTEAGTASPNSEWLNLEGLADVEVTSEDETHPIESALMPGQGSGWRAAGPGQQRIRLHFHHPQGLRRILIQFVEAATKRTQEYVLRWSSDEGKSFREIVRQQWNFSPEGSTSETDDYQVELLAVTALELDISPDISGGNTPASLAQWRLA